MKTSGKLLIVLGIVAVFVVGLAVGVSFSTLLVASVLLACPAMMLFGMHEMRQAAAARAATSTRILGIKYAVCLRRYRSRNEQRL